jgi:hypothetical protein
MILASNEYIAIENLSIDQFKKVLTCVFLISGLSVPADYLHIDIEVVDYVGVNTKTKKDLKMDIVDLNLNKPELTKETK